MKKLIALATVLSVFGAAANAAPKKAVKAKDLWVCPINKEVIADHSAAGKGPVVNGRVIHFCCAGCGPQFNKLTAKQKAAAIATAAKLEKTASVK